MVSLNGGENRKGNEMTNEKLYQLMKDGFDQVNQRLDKMDQRLDEMDTRLRDVENSISERKGKQNMIAGMRNWITIVCATGAVTISIAVAIFK